MFHFQWFLSTGQSVKSHMQLARGQKLVRLQQSTWFSNQLTFCFVFGLFFRMLAVNSVSDIFVCMCVAFFQVTKAHKKKF